MNTKLIIGIHGLNNKPEPDILRDWWMAAIAEGISRNCRGQRADFDFVLAYWADVLYSAPVASTEQKEPYVVAGGGGSLPKAGSSTRRTAAALIREGAFDLDQSCPSAPGYIEKSLRFRAAIRHS